MGGVRERTKERELGEASTYQQIDLRRGRRREGVRKWTKDS